jgi:alpha-L-rhamnosidase
MTNQRFFLIFLIFFTFFSTISTAQKIESAILDKEWKASWVTVPKASPYDYGIYMFRKTVDLAAKPASFVVHVSADNRYKLFINEKLVSLGPARGDLSHWNFETVDVSPYLKSGKNTFAALVWNEGEDKPEGQVSFRTGFILQGATELESIVNTNVTWKCLQDSSFAPFRVVIPTYYVAGTGEIRNFSAHPKQWQKTDFDDSDWNAAKPFGNGLPKTMLGQWGNTNGWMLVPSPIPQMEMTEERLKKLVYTEGVFDVGFGMSDVGNAQKSDILNPKLNILNQKSDNPNLKNLDFPAQKATITIPKQSVVTLVLDQTYLTNAYPTVLFSGGKNASISISYAEALYSKFPQKGNRNETKDKVFLGRKDSLISDGTGGQQFTPLAYRTYRYVQLRIVTQAEPLVLNDIYGTFTGFPFEYRAKMSANNAEMDKILDIGWRTARLCAVETYMDCPYYEQLQYIGDTRIQALVSLFNAGDERLVKNALNQIDFSRQPEGVTMSRFPTATPQYIPTFSLWYIGMLQDYSRYGRDVAFVKGKLGGVRSILDYFKNYQQADGSLKNVPQWMFSDWVEAKNWQAGIGPMSANGNSAMLDMQLLWAYQVASDLETKLGMPAFAAQYQIEIDRLKKTIWEKYWDADKKLFADRIEKDGYSQHTNTLAILTGLLNPEQSAQMAQQLLTNKELTTASIYFKYYVHQALIKAGMGNDYLKWLDKWRENINSGLTTWAEMSDVDQSRSDCHAWGSSPNIEFFRTVLGIDSDGLGFSKVKIEPHLGQITKIGGQIPHPQGVVSVQYQLERNKWHIEIELPKTVTGTLVWKGKSIDLKEGLNRIHI